MKKILLLLCTCLILLPGASLALPVGEIIWQQDDDFEGTLAADFEAVSYRGGSVTITLSNLSVWTDPGDFPSTPMLTGFGFNLPEGYYIREARINNLFSEFWGYDNIRGNDGGPFVNYVQSSHVNSVVATLGAAVEAPLYPEPSEGYPSGWNGIVSGPNHGILPDGVTGVPADWDYYQGSADISIYVGALEFAKAYTGTDLAEFIKSHDTVASFGSPEMAPVPEPATLLLFGTGLIGLAGIGRKKFKK